MHSRVHLPLRCGSVGLMSSGLARVRRSDLAVSSAVVSDIKSSRVSPHAAAQKALRWYLRSWSDEDTHRGVLHYEDTTSSYVVTALCGLVFVPMPTWTTQGSYPDVRLCHGPYALPGKRPGDPDQICPACSVSAAAGVSSR